MTAGPLLVVIDEDVVPSDCSHVKCVKRAKDPQKRDKNQRCEEDVEAAVEAGLAAVKAGATMLSANTSSWRSTFRVLNTLLCSSCLPWPARATLHRGGGIEHAPSSGARTLLSGRRAGSGRGSPGTLDSVTLRTPTSPSSLIPFKYENYQIYYLK